MKRMMRWFVGGLVSIAFFFFFSSILINFVLMEGVAGKDISSNSNFWNAIPIEYLFAAKGVLLVVFSPLLLDRCVSLGLGPGGVCGDASFYLFWIAIFCSICFWGWLNLFVKDKVSQRFASIHFVPKYAIPIILTSLVILVNAWVLAYIDDGGNLFNDRVNSGRYEYLPVGKFLSEKKLLP